MRMQRCRSKKPLWRQTQCPQVLLMHHSPPCMVWRWHPGRQMPIFRAALLAMLLQLQVSVPHASAGRAFHSAQWHPGC